MGALIKDTPDNFRISENDLYREGKKRLTRYGKYVITNRAVPDYRDGMKVVHRRIIWALKNLGSSPTGKYLKTSLVYGDVIGRFHPHGDKSVNDAIVTLANSPVSLMKTKGNFGTWRDPPSEGRYTEIRLSKYSDLMLDSDYLNAWKSKIMIPTYTNDDIEPLVLPALVPHLLLNGNQGIAYGVTSNFPPIHPETVFELLNKQLEGKEINIKKLASKIKFNWLYGSECISETNDIINWLESGKGSLYFCPDYEINESKRTIIFNEVPPNFNWLKVSEKVAGLDYVASIDDSTDRNTVKSATITVRLNNKAIDDFDKKSQKIIDIFTNFFANASNITIRNSEEDIEFERQTLTGFLKKWVDYRVQLEVDMQTYRIERIKEAIARQNLMLWVVDNVDAIVKIIKTHETPREELMRKFELSQDDAEYILDMQMRRISRLSVDAINKTKINLKRDKKEAIGYRDQPVSKVTSDLHSSINLINKSVTECRRED